MHHAVSQKFILLCGSLTQQNCAAHYSTYLSPSILVSSWFTTLSYAAAAADESALPLMKKKRYVLKRANYVLTSIKYQ